MTLKHLLQTFYTTGKLFFVFIVIAISSRVYFNPKIGCPSNDNFCLRKCSILYEWTQSDEIKWYSFSPNSRVKKDPKTKYRKNL